MFSRIGWKDPILEIKRDGYLVAEKEQQDDLVKSYKLSISKTRHIHANLLFTTHEGYSILKGICRLVTYVESSVSNTSWKDLAIKLGYSDVDVKCIANLRGNVYDPTEMVLKYYASSNQDGSVGDILQALLDLGFLPAVHHAHSLIEHFIAEVQSVKGHVTQTPSEKTGTCETRHIFKDENFKPVVPAIFNTPSLKKEVLEDVDCNVTRQVEVLQQSACIRSQKQAAAKQTKKYCKYVMLSFAADGYSMAQKVASVLRSRTNKKGYPIGVLMLCENEEIVVGNPGQIISDLIAKMDYVVPILTEGYFKVLRQGAAQARLLDERYVQLIHDCLVSQYIHNNCLNVNVRSIVARSDVNSICRHPDFVHNTVLHAWRTDEQLTSLAECVVRSHRKRNY